MTKISILMSLYAKESAVYLQGCFLSLHQQTYYPDEVVLVLDGVVGNELSAVVDDWKERLPLKIIALPENVGLGRALNIGLANCSNELVARLDTDDECYLDRLQKQVQYMNEHPEIVLLGAAVDEFDENLKKYIIQKRTIECHEDIKNYARKRNPFNHMSVVFRKQVILSLGGYRHHLYMEDYNLWIRVIASGARTANCPNSLVKVRAGNAMLLRRRGLSYVKSEFQLAWLKVNTGLDTKFSAYYIFALRSLVRLLPPCILSKIYILMRRYWVGNP